MIDNFDIIIDNTGSQWILRIDMNYDELLEKYYTLHSENNSLREEIKRLKLHLGIPEQPGIPFDCVPKLGATEPKPMPKTVKADYNKVGISDINNLSNPSEEIKLLNQPISGERR
jgi:hypothetical protein